MTASEEQSQRTSLLQASERLVTSMAHVGVRLVSHPQVTAHTDKVSRELRQARAIGQLTVLTATSKLKNAFAGDETTRSPEPAPTPPAEVRDAPACIPDYANLSAAQIVPLLGALTADERIDVATYEESTRKRKTILSALADSTS